MGAPKYIFTVRLAGCGTERRPYRGDTHDYARIRENNVLHLVTRVLEQLCTAFINPERKALFFYDLACYLLNKLSFDWAYLPPDLWTQPKRIHLWGVSNCRGIYPKNKFVQLREESKTNVRNLRDAKSTHRRRA